ncbi:hypothetical protein SAMN04515671_0494 [Nakamurella panacisegetis]|uniref:Uncharacterized protein n=1 Tax=Nakamurella panacisegetis TaxID=1090615 RepID=A0A1H0IGF4_9ACTN|nr:hypothetical protein [Nakamurella panacisegetis]SDO30426.1 hypothetical protein SAMN04515671_0494 [Nakamurella panacisegetis]
MTSTTTPGPQLTDLFRRLWAWNVSSWQHGDRIELARVTLRRLAAMASDSDGLARPDVPDVGPHALADQLFVLAADALGSGCSTEAVEAVLLDLGGALRLR